MKKITILTPSYNRAHTLPVLYESLLKQDADAFEWLVVDDGSTDATEKLVEGWRAEGKITIRYIRKQNGGKHTALNEGIRLIESELTFIVDSDDWLPENAVEIILKYHEKYRGTEGLCGYSFLRFYPDGKVNDAFYPKDEWIDTYVNARINAGIAGDKAEVFYTEILKQFPFPVYEGEKFVPEDLVWVQMSGPYKMVHINQCIYISDYLEDGLTRSGKRMKIHSPKAMTKRARIYLNDDAVNKKTKCKMCLLYVIYGHFAGMKERELMDGLKRKIWYAVGILPGMILYIIWKRKFGEIRK